MSYQLTPAQMAAVEAGVAASLRLNAEGAARRAAARQALGVGPEARITQCFDCGEWFATGFGNAAYQRQWTGISTWVLVPVCKVCTPKCNW
jgi:uncharacterized SAM-binding protein YcdF (DUF218 family)